MFRIVTSAVMLSAFFAMSAFAQAADEKKPVTDSWYRWSTRGEPAGYFHIVRKASGEDAAPVLLRVDLVVNWKGRQMGVHTQMTCLDDAYLSPVRIVTKGEGDDDEVKSCTATVERKADGSGKLKVVEGDTTVISDIPADTVPGFALFEVVRTLPFDAEKPFECSTLDPAELRVGKNGKFSYLGKDEQTIDGEARSLHKFQFTSDQNHRPIEFWLTDDHQLVRVLMDGYKEYVLTTEEKAKATLKE